MKNCNAVFLLCLVLLSKNLFAQRDSLFFVGTVLSDTTSTIRNEYPACVSPIMESRKKIEIRFIELSSWAPSNDRYSILSYDSEWRVDLYPWNCGSSEDRISDSELKIDLDSVFVELVKNRIFSLPSSKQVETEPNYFDPNSDQFTNRPTRILDGSGYWIEYKVGKKYRRYKYNNPKSRLEFKPNSHEFKCFSNIMDVFSELRNSK